MSARRRSALLVVPLAAALLGVGAGCGGDDTEPTPTPDAGSSPPSDVVARDGLPEDFPTDEVPLVEGEIGEVLENEELHSYLVKVYPDTDFGTAFEQATEQLTSAGFAPGKDVISAGPSSSTADFTSDEWFVVITGGLPDKVMVQYSIYPADG